MDRLGRSRGANRAPPIELAPSPTCAPAPRHTQPTRGTADVPRVDTWRTVAHEPGHAELDAVVRASGSLYARHADLRRVTDG